MPDIFTPNPENSPELHWCCCLACRRVHTAAAQGAHWQVYRAGTDTALLPSGQAVAIARCRMAGGVLDDLRGAMALRWR